MKNNLNYLSTSIRVDFINKKVYVESCSFEFIENIKKAIIAYGDNLEDYEITHEKSGLRIIDTKSLLPQSFDEWNPIRYDNNKDNNFVGILKSLNNFPNDSK
jgi:hypothetical protein